MEALKKDLILSWPNEEDALEEEFEEDDEEERAMDQSGEELTDATVSDPSRELTASSSSNSNTNSSSSSMQQQQQQ